MIVLLGPDHSGKSTLTRKLGALGYNTYHFTRESNYEDYIIPLTKLDFYDAVLDRHAICEYPYSTVMGREFKFYMKEWHNIMLLTLIQNPVTILCTNKPPPSQYDAQQYLPYDKWDECLSLYRQFLSSHHIRYVEYDYAGPITPNTIANTIALLEKKHREYTKWWKPMWENGYGCIGGRWPKVLLVAERIGPNNMNCIPFETGPTGHMLTKLLVKTKIPYARFAITNLVKSYRRDDRPPNDRDLELFKVELEALKPEKVVFMGAVAKHGVSVVRELGIPYDEVVHLGYFHHRTRTLDIPEQYASRWRDIMGMTPHTVFKVQE